MKLEQPDAHADLDAHKITPTGDWSLVVASNDEQVLRTNLLLSPAIDRDCEIIIERGAESAGQALNRGLERASSDIVVFAHQDVYLPCDWTWQLFRAIQHIEASGHAWGVLGVFGMTRDTRPIPFGYCYSTGLRNILGAPFPSPVPARTLDELVLVVRRSSGLRFDERLPGFHLYGADICLQAQAWGLETYVIPAFCVHNSNGIVELPRAFWSAYFFLRKKWLGRLPIHTCCTTITRTAWPVLHRLAVEYRQRLAPRQVGKRERDIPSFYRQLCADHSMIAPSHTNR